MKQRKLFLSNVKLAILVVLTILLVNCSKQDNNDPASNSKIVITGIDESTVITPGAILDLELNIQESKVTSAIVYFDGTEIDNLSYFPQSFSINTSGKTSGIYSLKVVAYMGVEELDIYELDIEILSVEYGSLTDADGNEYKTIQIGNQVWMAENLKIKHYRNGDDIRLVNGGNTWAELESGAYCYPNNDVTNEPAYGLLYNFYSVNDARNIAPEGWHIPSREEFRELMDYLGGYDDAGGKLKTVGNTFWSSTLITADNEGTNESGFSAVAAGVCNASGSCSSFGYKTNFWFSDESTSLSGNLLGWTRYLGKSTNEISDESTSPATLGYSVRCIKD